MLENLLSEPYWIIDFLPEQVPDSSPGQYFAVEQFYLKPNQQAILRRQFAEILFRLNCYYDIQVCEPENENWRRNPSPEDLLSWIRKNTLDLCIHVPDENTLITLYTNDTCMTVYHPSEKLLERTRQLTAGLGLFLWQPPQEEKLI